jgi:carboxymethylenebutenolidase
MTDNNPILEKTIQVPRPSNPGRAMEAFLAQPEERGLYPGILVIHEILGLNEDIRQITRQFARHGYVSLAIDLFSGQNKLLCLLQVFHGLLIRPMKNRILEDLGGALDALKNTPEVDANHTGVVGFCMGGGYALQLASAGGQIRSASVFYGTNPRPLDVVASSCPIVGSYPEKDYTARAARELEAALDQHQVPHDIKIYPGARHSFFNQFATHHDPAASQDAWKRMFSFFDQYLRDASHLDSG